MSTTTANLGLFKYNTTTDANVAFNINTALNDNWDKIDAAVSGGSSRNIGEIIASTIPLTDAGLHLLDGTLLSGSGIYAGFVDYIANLYETNPNASYFAQGYTEEILFSQPVLSANGTMGGASFAVASSSDYNDGTYAWHAFDNNTNTEWVKNRSEETSWITLYNPIPLNVTMLEMKNRQVNNTGNAFVTSGKVYGSNDNSNWSLLTSFTNSNTTQGGVWNIDMSSNTAYYKYYKIENLTYTASYDYGYNQINITATYQGANYTPEQVWQQYVTAHGVCGKFVYDRTNNTVRLPKYNNKIYTKDLTSTAPVKGNGMTLGVTNGTVNAALMGYQSGQIAVSTYAPEGYGQPVSTSTYYVANVTGSFGVTTDASKSGIITDLSNITVSLDGYYYIVVATSTKTDIEVDIDVIATDLNGKCDVDGTNATFSHVTETYVNGASWYRIWSDGWCEQGGEISSTQQNTSYNLLKTMKDTNYTINITAILDSWSGGLNSVYNLTTSSFKVWTSDDSTFNSCNLRWEVKGYIR